MPSPQALWMPFTLSVLWCYSCNTNHVPFFSLPPCHSPVCLSWCVVLSLLLWQVRTCPNVNFMGRGVVRHLIHWWLPYLVQSAAHVAGAVTRLRWRTWTSKMFYRSINSWVHSLRQPFTQRQSFNSGGSGGCGPACLTARTSIVCWFHWVILYIVVCVVSTHALKQHVALRKFEIVSRTMQWPTVQGGHRPMTAGIRTTPSHRKRMTTVTIPWWTSLIIYFNVFLCDCGRVEGVCTSATAEWCPTCLVSNES